MDDLETLLGQCEQIFGGSQAYTLRMFVSGNELIISVAGDGTVGFKRVGMPFTFFPGDVTTTDIAKILKNAFEMPTDDAMTYLKSVCL